MEKIEPQAILVASTQIHDSAIDQYLTEIGVSESARESLGQWNLEARKGRLLKNPSEAERLVMFAGKMCYKSFEEGLNPNVTKVRKNNKEYLTNLLKVGHGSVLEHASFSFLFFNVSRVFTHELVRHRAGTAMSQESLRFVRPEEIKFWIPSILKQVVGEPYVSDRIKEVLEKVTSTHKRMGKLAGIDKMKFEDKKKLTSALRRILPQGMSTAILFTMNLRAVRHIVQMRTSPHAEEEIRIVFDKVAKIMQKECPILFSDMERDDSGCWTTKYPANPYDYNKEG